MHPRALSHWGGSGNRQFYNRSAALAGFDRHFPAAHHLKPLPDIVEGNVRSVIIDRFKAWPVVRNDDLTAGIRPSGLNGNVQRI